MYPQYSTTPKYKQNDIINFSFSDGPDTKIKGTGKVCGVADTGVPILGIGYIIEIIELYQNEQPLKYEYTHIKVAELFIKE